MNEKIKAKKLEIIKLNDELKLLIIEYIKNEHTPLVKDVVKKHNIDIPTETKAIIYAHEFTYDLTYGKIEYTDLIFLNEKNKVLKEIPVWNRNDNNISKLKNDLDKKVNHIEYSLLKKCNIKNDI